jgi:uncharacterized protein (DUF885 family)
VDARLARLDRFVDRAHELSTAAISDREHTMLAALSFSARSIAASLPFERDLALVAAPVNLATFLSVLVPGYALTTREHGEGYVAKLRSLPTFVDGWIAGLRAGVECGRVATHRGVTRAVAAFEAHLASALEDDPLASQSPPSEASLSEAAAWRTDVIDAIRDAARPAIVRLLVALHDEVLPSARTDDTAGICHIPGGVDAYPGLLRAATSTELTPESVHEIGLAQLARLDDEYRVLGPSTVGIDEPEQIRARLRTDASLRYATSDEIVADAVAAVARAQAEAPRWFAKMPRAGCTAIAVEAGPMAFYTGPSPDGARPGTYFYNTSDPSLWSRCQLEATTFHEAVPGHHLQLALAQEFDLHPVLGELEVDSYGEGWGLYAERLADEMSLYSSPLQRLGMVTLDSLRAARLVVDTGLHALGWTRDAAIEFFVHHTAQEERNATAEIDRYIATPGQATSYMIGRLEIDRLRGAAESRLGSRFSVRGFHETVLGNGMTPLPELARTVDAWIEHLLGPPAPQIDGAT